MRRFVKSKIENFKLNRYSPVLLIFILILEMVAGAIIPFKLSLKSPYVSSQKALAAGESWYATGGTWSYRKQITIDHTKVADVATPSATYANFPVLISLDALSNIQANGTDIRFTSSDGVTELPREIEKYSSGSLKAWVKTTLTKDSSDSTDDIIYMYYGNSSATTDYAATDPYGSQNVWKSTGDTSTVIVQHMKEDPSGAAPQMIDSTANVNNGTSVGTMLTTDQVAGQIDGSLDFDGVNDGINIPNSLNMTQYTISMWVKPNSLSQNNNVLIVNSRSAYYSQYMIYLTSNNKVNFRIDKTTGVRAPLVSTVAYSTNWQYFTFVFNRSTQTIYNNGVYDNSSTYADIYPVFQPTQYNTIGHLQSVGGGNGFNAFNGSIDEVRIYSRALTAEEITTQYNNTNSPSTFVKTLGAGGGA